jgi:hypothetical protein
LANMIYEHIDEGCKERVLSVHEREYEKWQDLHDNIDTHIENIPNIPEITVNETNKVKDIKEFAYETLGYRLHGTKKQMLAALKEEIERMTIRRNDTIKELYEKIKQPPKPPLFLISEEGKKKIKDFKKQKITLTTARTRYKVNLTELDKLECTVMQNPHYRHAAPMRLYKLIDVLEIADKKAQKKESV